MKKREKEKILETQSHCVNESFCKFGFTNPKMLKVWFLAWGLGNRKWLWGSSKLLFSCRYMSYKLVTQCISKILWAMMMTFWNSDWKRKDCRISHSSGTLGHPNQPPPTDNFMLTHAVFVILLMPRKSSGQKNACLIFLVCKNLQKVFLLQYLVSGIKSKLLNDFPFLKRQMEIVMVTWSCQEHIEAGMWC